VRQQVALGGAALVDGQGPALAGPAVALDAVRLLPPLAPSTWAGDEETKRARSWPWPPSATPPASGPGSGGGRSPAATRPGAARHVVTGKWTRTEAWPHVSFLGRVPFHEVAEIHGRALATVLLLPDR
jgi:hypothetical protein